MEEIFNLRDRFAAIIDLMRLVCFVLFVSHFCACVWFLVGRLEAGADQPSWLTQNDLLYADTFSQYTNALYFSTITILTVGYGDVTPVNNLEKWFVIVMALITCGVFGYSINNIGTIFQEMQEKKQAYKLQMTKINKYMNYHRISQHLKL